MLEAILFLDRKGNKSLSSVIHEIRSKSELLFLLWGFNFFLVNEILLIHLYKKELFNPHFQ